MYAVFNFYHSCRHVGWCECLFCSLNKMLALHLKSDFITLKSVEGLAALHKSVSKNIKIMCRLHVAKLFPVSHSMIWKDVSEVRIHIYIQLLRVPVCCWVCRRTLTDFDLVTMCTFNHYVCLSAVAFAGEHWLWHWPGDHVYIQPFSVPVCCCVCRRTLTVTLT